MNYLNFEHYISGTARVGVGIGTTLILVRWVSGNTIVFSPEIIVKYGILGLIGYAFMVMAALLTFGKLGVMIQNDFPDGKTIGDYFYYKLHPAGYRLLLLFIFIIGLFSLAIEGLTAKIILNVFFDVPSIVGLVCFILFCVLFGGFGGSVWIRRFSVFQIVSLFTAAIIIPVYFFIQEGISEVYEGIQLYHPYLLVFKNHEGLLFIASGMIVGFGRVLSDTVTWQRLFSLEARKIAPAFLLSSIIWLSFPLAFASFFFIIIFTGGFQDVFSLWLDLNQKLLNSPLLSIIFFLCVFSAITSTYAAILHSLISLFVKNVYGLARPNSAEKQKFTIGHVSAIFIGGLSIPFVLFFDIADIKVFFFGGNIFSALIAPILTIIFSKGKVSSFIPFSGLIGLIAGMLTHVHMGILHSIWVSALIPLLMILLYLFWKKITLLIFNRAQKET